MTENINQRIKIFIDYKRLKNIEVARAINVDPSFISQLVSGKRNASDRTILDICRIYGVNEIWLRTGEGEMFKQKSREEEIGTFIGDVISGDDEFKRSFISALAELNEDGWDVLKSIAFKIVEKHSQASSSYENKKSEP